MNVGELREALADLPDYLPVHLVDENVPAWWPERWPWIGNEVQAVEVEQSADLHAVVIR